MFRFSSVFLVLFFSKLLVAFPIYIKTVMKDCIWKLIWKFYSLWHQVSCNVFVKWNNIFKALKCLVAYTNSDFEAKKKLVDSTRSQVTWFYEGSELASVIVRYLEGHKIADSERPRSRLQFIIYFHVRKNICYRLKKKEFWNSIRT